MQKHRLTIDPGPEVSQPITVVLCNRDLNSCLSATIPIDEFAKITLVPCSEEEILEGTAVCFKCGQ